MIGIVIVSHSEPLARGVAELAAQVSQGNVSVAVAGGTADPANPIGTDAFRVLEAIESVYSRDGVLVLMDLGSAVLSAESALEFLDEERRPHVRLCAAPLVEGTVAAVTLAAASATLDEIEREAIQSLAPKMSQLCGMPAPSEATTFERKTVTLRNRLGLHARPAARFIRLARQFDARVLVENATAHAGPHDSNSLNGMLALGALQGHQLALHAKGKEAAQALSALIEFVEAGCGDSGDATSTMPAGHTTTPATAGEVVGIPASAGIAVGPLMRFRAAVVEVPRRATEDIDAELHRLKIALTAAANDIRGLYEWTRTHIGENEAGIFDAQLLFLEDPELTERATRLIRADSLEAATAWHETSRESVDRLAASGDPYLGGRAADLKDAASRVLRRLGGISEAPFAPDQPAILAAHDILPSEVEQFDPAKVVGLCLETGSASAHAAILVRARGIPAVVGLGPALAAIAEGTTVAIDGERGVVWISPGSDELRRVDERRREWLTVRKRAQDGRDTPAATRDGRRITVLANISREAEVFEALEYGAEGVGVLRTEFLFMNRKTPPGEEEQFAAYSSIARKLNGRPLVIRTLDIGGDKAVPYIDIGDEANPFMGWRGVRLTLSRRDLFEPQLRAILRAGAEHAVEILLPMVASLSELRQVKAIVSEIEDSLRREGMRFRSGVPIGVMIEVPAAVAVAGALASEASRLSIGTNDLIQYAMAADRTNSRVAPLAEPLEPAVLRMVRDTVAAGRTTGIRVDVCGEMAADPLALPLLIGLGVEEVSVSAPLIPEVKRSLARWSVADAEALASRAIDAESSAMVRRLIADHGVSESGR